MALRKCMELPNYIMLWSDYIKLFLWKLLCYKKE
jgi:hypothetical protein